MTASARHNPDVEPERPGYCVYRPQDGLFLMPNWAWGTSADRAHVVVYATLVEAARAASIFAGVVATVPRHNGYCVEWSYP